MRSTDTCPYSNDTKKCRRGGGIGAVRSRRSTGTGGFRRRNFRISNLPTLSRTRVAWPSRKSSSPKLFRDSSPASTKSRSNLVSWGCVANCCCINGLIFAYDDLPIFIRSNALPRRVAKGAPEFGVLQEAHRLLREILRITGFEEETGDFWVDKLTNSADVTTQNGLANGHGLERLKRCNKFGEAHTAARIDHDVHHGVVALNLVVRHTTYSVDVTSRVVFLNRPANLFGFGTITHYEHLERKTSLMKGHARANEPFDAFPRE